MATYKLRNEGHRPQDRSAVSSGGTDTSELAILTLPFAAGCQSRIKADSRSSMDVASFGASAARMSRKRCTATRSH